MNADSALRELVAKLEAEAGAASASGREGFANGVIHCIESILSAPQAAPAGMGLVPTAYQIANSFDAHRKGLPDEFQDWAAEISRDLRQLAAAPAAQVSQTVELDRFELLDIARDTGLRAEMHGVGAATARELLSRFLAAVDARRSAPAVVVDEAMVERLRASLWGSWGADRQTTDWPSRDELRAALAAALNQGKANG
jgi:hypothetical protein